MRQHYIAGGNGLKLYAEETGNQAGPAILFIHGFSSCRLAWSKQFDDAELQKDFRLVRLDIRGHGLSEKPTEAEAYTDSQLWADDIAAVIAELHLEKPGLVGWSYGGYIICDYIRHYGQAGVGGINFVAAATKMGGREAASLLGQEFIGLFSAFFSNDLTESVATFQKFIRLLTYHEPSPADFYQMLGYNLIVPPGVRQALFSRRLNNDDLLSGLKLPMLLTHGTEDGIILPAASEHCARLIPQARLSVYPEIGHNTCLEDPARFNAELAAFVREWAG